jgi:hypothetical protein
MKIAVDDLYKSMTYLPKALLSRADSKAASN